MKREVCMDSLVLVLVLVLVPPLLDGASNAINNLCSYGGWVSMWMTSPYALLCAFCLHPIPLSLSVALSVSVSMSVSVSEGTLHSKVNVIRWYGALSSRWQKLLPTLLTTRQRRRARSRLTNLDTSTS